jgi:hypothetical protein
MSVVTPMLRVSCGACALALLTACVVPVPLGTTYTTGQPVPVTAGTAQQPGGAPTARACAPNEIRVASGECRARALYAGGSGGGGSSGGSSSGGASSGGSGGGGSGGGGSGGGGGSTGGGGGGGDSGGGDSGGGGGGGGGSGGGSDGGSGGGGGDDSGGGWQ